MTVAGGGPGGGNSVAIVVVNYRSHALLAENLPAGGPGGEAAGTPDEAAAPLVVVVDSWSTAQERAAVERLAGERGWHLVGPDHNTGFGAGMNLGVGRAFELGARVAVLVNPDARVEPESVAALAAAAERAPMSLVAPVILRPDGSVWSHGYTYLSLDDGIMRSAVRPPRSTRERAWLSGAVLAVSAQLWAAVGGFDERYFMYWEDVDLSARVEAAGGDLVVLPEARAIHDEGGTQRIVGEVPARAKSGLYYYHNIRNRLLYAATWLGPADRLAWRRTSLRAARAIVLQGGKRQLLRSAEPWLAAVRGTRDGLRLSRR